MTEQQWSDVLVKATRLEGLVEQKMSAQRFLSVKKLLLRILFLLFMIWKQGTERDTQKKFLL